jgi:hypothetical protein
MALTIHPPPSAEVKERVQQYLFLCGPSMPVLGSLINSAASYMFRPLVVAIFMKVFFERYIT